MKLKDVATVIHGVKILPEHLQTEMEPGALAVVTDENIKNGLVEKESVRFMKSNVYRRFYTQSDVRAKEGDYLYSDKTQQLIPFSSLGTETMPGDDFLIVRAGGAYLGTFLGHPNGPKYLIQELHKITISEAPDKTERIGDIYLPSDFAELDEMFYVRPDKRRDIDLSKINIKQGWMSLDFIIKQITQNVIDMNSNDYFQRKDRLWDDGKKSRFIEALILKHPVPAFYFDCSDEDHWLVVDGLQRLGTVREFIIEKKIPLTDLYYLPEEYEGKTFDQLPIRAQRNIEGYQVMAYTIEAPTPKEVKYKIFKSINE